MKRIMGIDEAGRGCVIGPMVVCGVVVSDDTIDALRKLGVKDSKLLSPQSREVLCEGISSVIQTSFVAEVPPEQIDRENINVLALREMARMITDGAPDEVYIDAPVRGRGISAYCRKLRALLRDSDVTVVAENKADLTYPVVSAASIIAKVTRDNVIRKLYDEYGNFGSGYPSDPRTVRFVTESYTRTGEFPPIVRHKWLTVRRLTSCGQSTFPFSD